MGRDDEADTLARARAIAGDINKRLDPDVDVAVGDDTRALFRSMNDQALLALRAAHLADRAQPTATARGRAFSSGRIEAIEAILAERGVSWQPWFTPDASGAVDTDGRVMTIAPGDARRRVLEMFDDPAGELVAVVMRHRGDVGVYVSGEPSRQLLEDLEQATAAYRRIIRRHEH